MDDIAKNSLRIIEIARLLDEHKAENTIAINIGKISSFTDYFIITTVQSQAHLKGLLDHLYKYFNENDIQPLNNIKNMDKQGWVLIDCGNFIIHLMDEEMRKFYELEKLWFKSEFLYQSSKSS